MRPQYNPEPIMTGMAGMLVQSRDSDGANQTSLLSRYHPYHHYTTLAPGVIPFYESYSPPLPMEGPQRKQRRKRQNFTQFHLNILEEAFSKNRYPDAQKRQSLAERTGLCETRVQIWFKNRRAKEKQLLRKGQADSSTSPSASSSTPRKPVATSKRKCTSRPAVHTITSADSATVKEENAPQTVYPDSDSVSSELLPSVSLMSTCTSASPSPPVTPASPFSYNFEYQRERTYAGIYDNFSNWHENSQYYGHNYHYAAYNQSYQQNWQGSHMQMGYTQGNTYQPNAASATYPMGAAAGYASHSNYGDQGAEHDVSYSYMQGTER